MFISRVYQQFFVDPNQINPQLLSYSRETQLNTQSSTFQRWPVVILNCNFDKEPNGCQSLTQIESWIANYCDNVCVATNNLGAELRPRWFEYLLVAAVQSKFRIWEISTKAQVK